jgi:hypothetical protein
VAEEAVTLVAGGVVRWYRQHRPPGEFALSHAEDEMFTLFLLLGGVGLTAGLFVTSLGPGPFFVAAFAVYAGGLGDLVGEGFPLQLILWGRLPPSQARSSRLWRRVPLVFAAAAFVVALFVPA